MDRNAIPSARSRPGRLLERFPKVWVTEPSSYTCLIDSAEFVPGNHLSDVRYAVTGWLVPAQGTCLSYQGRRTLGFNVFDRAISIPADTIRLFVVNWGVTQIVGI